MRISDRKALRLVILYLIAALGFMGITMAGERVFSITDLTGRGFAPDLVEYGLEGSVAPAAWSLVDADGQPVPCHITTGAEGGRLYFVASVPHDATATWKLIPRPAGPAKGSVSLTAQKDVLTLRNSLLSIVMPAEQDRTFKTPVPADTLPAPIRSWNSRQNGDIGASRILSKRLAQRLRVRVTHRNDVFCETVYEITWAEGGFYRCTVRVIDRVPIVKVMEEFDLGQLDGTDYWEMDLTKGWAPDTLETARPGGNGTNIDMGSERPTSWLMEPGQKDRPFLPLGSLFSQGHIGLTEKASRAAKPDSFPMAGMVVQHKGDWKRATVMEIHSESEKDVRVRLPMSARKTTWRQDTGSITSPFSMHTIDPALPSTYGRRHWALMLAPVEIPRPETATVRTGMLYQNPVPFAGLPLFVQARPAYGLVGLNRYKDYVLDWPAPTTPHTRIWRAGKTPETLRAELKKAALPEGMKDVTAKTFATFNAQPEQRAAAQKSQFRRAVDGYLKPYASLLINSPTLSHHATGEGFTGAQLVDDLLAQPDLPDDMRRELRMRSALVNYLHHEPDVMYFGSGAHPGNPNMGDARFFPGLGYIPLIPDHPMYTAWKTWSCDYAAYLLGIQMAPGGAWFEYGTYHMHGFRITNVLPAIEAMKPENMDLIFDYCRQDFDYYMHCITPHDKRYGSRLTPGLANSSTYQPHEFLNAAGSFERKDPEFAAWMRGIWEESGARPADMALAPLTLAGQTPPLRSRHFPGFGAIFRAHQGPDETWMLLRNGFLWSHWYIDPGHFLLASRGALLVPYQPYQYYTSPHKDWDMYNTVRFGHPENQMPYGWPDSNILATSFGGSTEYAWSSTGIPDWFIKPGVSEAFRKEVAGIPNAAERKLDPAFTQQEGALEWDRQVFFLKGKTAASPNYFVFRDTVRGDGKLASYLFLNLLGTKKDIAFAGNAIAVNTEYPVKLDILFPDRDMVKADLHEELHRPQWIGSALQGQKRDEPVSPNWVDPQTGQPTGDLTKAQERHVFLRIADEPGKGAFWVLWPRGEKEARPKVSLLAENVMRIEHREGTDYVFAGAEPFTHEEKNLSFQGRAGTLRLHKNDVDMMILTGEGSLRWKDVSCRGIGPIGNNAAPAVPERVPAGAPDTIISLPEKAPEGWTLRVRQNGEKPVREDGFVMEGGLGAILTHDDGTIRYIAPRGEYVKLIAGSVGIRGVGPFDLTFTPESITGRTTGAERTLVTTAPGGITRPMYHLNGRRWYAGFADDPTISRGTVTPQFGLAFAVGAGEQLVEVREWSFPPMPPVPPRAALQNR